MPFRALREHLIAFQVMGLEIFAIALAVLQQWQGLKTDEAKYLLNIPYPHPPLARWIFSAVGSHLPSPELFWRIVLATILVQSVWLIHDLALSRSYNMRCPLCAGWLLSAAMMSQAGTIMMAPLTALSGLVFMYAYLKNECSDAEQCVQPRAESPLWSKLFLPQSAFSRRGAGQTAFPGRIDPFWIACLWFASLFTAYQAILLLPLALAIFLRRCPDKRQAMLYSFAPIALLVLYSLSNPLALAGFGLAGGKDASMPLFARAEEFLRVWSMGGSLILSALGTLGIFVSRRRPVIISFLLICAYVALSNHDYYAILFTPFFVLGLFFLLPPSTHPSSIVAFILFVVAMVAFDAVAVIPQFFHRQPSIARETMERLQVVKPPPAKMLIVGPFGHEWQFYSPYDIVKYSDKLQGKKADIVVCLRECDHSLLAGKSKMTETLVEVYIRQ